MTGPFTEAQTKRYIAFLNATHEYGLIEAHLKHEYFKKQIPIKPEELSRKKVLDLGCGTGVCLEMLAEVFSGHMITAVDRSSSQLITAKENKVKGVLYLKVPFEDFNSAFAGETAKDYDFIFACHVLQYIDTDPEPFILKIYESLAPDGEAWIIQQTSKGMAEMIEHQKPYLLEPRFKEWKTFSDYVEIVDELSKKKDFNYDIKVLPTYFAGIDLKNPSPEEKLKLEFFFCLDKNFDKQEDQFKQHLATLEQKFRADQPIYHPNGIIKIRK